MSVRSPLAVTRRMLIASLTGVLGLAAPAVRAGEPVRTHRPLTLLDTYVAGTAYYEAHGVRGELRPGDALVLRREPDNAYDGLAIEVFTAESVKLGYVPRADNEPFARLMDAGETVTAEVIDVDPSYYEDIAIRLTLWIA